MGRETGISWTDHTFNPWLGCLKVSEGCAHCYAEHDTPARTHRAKGLELWGPPSTASRVRTSDEYWKQPARWDRAAARDGVRRRVFCASQADVFEDNELVVGWRTRLFEIIERTPHLDWQLLTKRPENLRRFLPASWMKDPRPNVWLGTTVENQATANKRVPELLRVPAAVHFLSCEPLLDAIDLRSLADEQCDECGTVVLFDAFQAAARCECTIEGAEPVACARISWVIVGGESGRRARQFDLEWARSIVSQCAQAGVAVFFKQAGSNPVDSGGGSLVALRLSTNHGDQMDDLPPELRVQEFPHA